MLLHNLIDILETLEHRPDIKRLLQGQSPLPGEITPLLPATRTQVKMSGL